MADSHITDSIQELVDDVAEMASDAKDYVVETAEDIAGAAVETAADLAGDAIELAGEAAAYVQDDPALAEQAAAINEELTEDGRIVGGSIANPEDAELAAQAEVVMDEMETAVRETVGEAIAEGSDFVGDGIEKLANMRADAIENIDPMSLAEQANNQQRADDLREAGAAINENLSDVGEAAGAVIADPDNPELVADLKEEVSEAVEAAGLTDELETATEFVQAAGERAGNAIEDIQQVGGAVVDVAESVGDLAENIAGVVVENAGDLAGDLVNLQVDVGTAIATTAMDAVGIEYDQAKVDKMQEFGDAIDDSLTEISEAMGDRIADSDNPELDGAIKESIDNAQDRMSEVLMANNNPMDGMNIAGGEDVSTGIEEQISQEIADVRSTEDIAANLGDGIA